MITKPGRTPRSAPFDMSGFVRTDNGVLRYSALDTSLLEMLRASVDRYRDHECIVVPGERLSCQQVWDRSARVADGLRAAGVAPQYVHFRTDPLPRNPAGKVVKPLLRDQTGWGGELR